MFVKECSGTVNAKVLLCKSFTKVRFYSCNAQRAVLQVEVDKQGTTVFLYQDLTSDCCICFTVGQCCAGHRA